MTDSAKETPWQARITGMGTATILDDVAAEVARHDAAMRAIAARVRREIVVPVCVNNGLRFDAHSGSFWFNSIDANGPVCDLSSEWECDHVGMPDLKAVIEVLRASAGGITTIGELVESFDPSA